MLKMKLHQEWNNLQNFNLLGWITYFKSLLVSDSYRYLSCCIIVGYLTNVLLVAWKGKTRIEDKAMECICQGLYEDPSSCELSDLLRQVTLYPPYHPLRFLVWQAGTVFFVQFTLHGCHKNKILKTYIIEPWEIYKHTHKSLLYFASKYHLGTYFFGIQLWFLFFSFISPLLIFSPKPWEYLRLWELNTWGGCSA